MIEVSRGRHARRRLRPVAPHGQAFHRLVPRFVAVLGVALAGCDGGGTSSEFSSPNTSSTGTTQASTSTTGAPVPTSTSSSTSTTTTSTPQSPEPAADLVAAAPVVDGYEYGEFEAVESALDGGNAVGVEVTGAGGTAMLYIEEGPVPLAVADQMELIRRVESSYGHNASAHLGWLHAGDFPILGFGNSKGENWLWFHDGLLFQVEGDPSILEFISGAGAAQHPEPGPSQESLELLEGTVGSRFLRVDGFSYVVPPLGMLLQALDDAVMEGVHYSMRVVAGPGTEVTVRDDFNIDVHGSQVIFVEASEMSLLNYGNIATVTPAEGDQGNGYRVEFVGGVPVFINDTSWQWLDGPMYMTAWTSEAATFDQIRPFLEQLVGAQAADPLSVTNWWRNP